MCTDAHECRDFVEKLLQTLRLALADHFSDIDAFAVSEVIRVDKSVVHVLLTSAEESSSDLVITVDRLRILKDGVDVGFIMSRDDTKIHVPNACGIAGVHTDVTTDMQWGLHRPHENNTVFTSSGSGRFPTTTTIEFLNQDNPATRTAKLVLPHKTDMIKNKKSLDILQCVYEEAVRDMLTSMGFFAIGTTVNIGTINVLNNVEGGAIEDDDKKRHTDDQLATMIVDYYPDLQTRLKLVPSLKSNNCNGVYYCDPVTNVWRQVSNVFLQVMIRKLFLEFPHQGLMTPADLKHVHSRRGRDDMVHMITTRFMDEDFADRLDENLDVFAVRNGLFDMRTKQFRDITPDDMVSKVANWDYDSEKASTYRDDVERFLAQVFPDAHERHVALSFVAHLMCGRRYIKKMLILTDRRDGNNGKTTFKKLLELFFSAHAETSDAAILLVCGGNIHNMDRNGHGEGLRTYRAIRLVVVEELDKTMTLDSRLIKTLVGESARISGRVCGVSDRFSFFWQAGIIMIFNEGHIPKYDTSDTALIERFAIAPMRSKFVARGELHNYADQQYTFEKDPTIAERMPDWLSALAMIFVDKFDESVSALDAIPVSMREWRTNITTESNPLHDWFSQNFRVTQDKADFIALETMFQYYTSQNSNSRDKMAAKEFKLQARSLLQGMGVAVKTKTSVKASDHTWKSVRDVAIGLVYSETALNVDEDDY